MLCLSGVLLNPGVESEVLPEPHRQRSSRAAGSFCDPVAEIHLNGQSLADDGL